MIRSVTLSLAIALASTAAFAQPSDSDRAAAVALFDEAERLSKEGNHAAACPKFADSNRLDPQLGALVHLADCYEKAGQLASAWASWRDALEISQKRSDSRADLAMQRIAALEPKLSKLLISVPDAAKVSGLTIKRDGAPITPSAWDMAVPVDAGEHTIEVSAPGKKSRSFKLTVEANAATATQEIEPLEDAPRTAGDAGAGGAGTGSPARDSGGSRGSTQRTLGWVAGGLGVLGLGAGLVFELRRSSKEDERSKICPTGKNCTADDQANINSLNDDVSSAAQLETISFIAGGALIAGGVILLLTAPTDDPKPAARWAVAPAVGKNTFGLAATGRW